MTNEPVAIATAVQGLIVAILAALVGYEVLTVDQSALFLGIAAAVIVLVGSIARSKVTPTSKL